MRELSYDRRLQLLALAAGFPGSFIAMILLWRGNYSSGAVWTLAFLTFSLWLGFAFSLRHRVIFSLQTLSNLLAALREEDFSLRARGARTDDAMGEVMIEVNALGEVLRQQRAPKGVCSGSLRRSWDWEPVWKEKPRTPWSWPFRAVPAAGGCVAGSFAKEACLITSWFLPI